MTEIYGIPNNGISELKLQDGAVTENKIHNNVISANKFKDDVIPIVDITDQCTFSWDTAPTSITAGTFPDSFLDKDPDTKLEFYCHHAGSGAQAKLQIDLPKTCFFFILGDIGLGAQISTYSSAGRSLYATQGLSTQNINQWIDWKKTRASNSFSERLLRYRSGLTNEYGNQVLLQWYSDTAGDYAFEIFNIRVLEFVGLSL